MGYMRQQINTAVGVQTSAHNSEQDAIDARLVDEMHDRISSAVRRIVESTRYAGLNPTINGVPTVTRPKPDDPASAADVPRETFEERVAELTGRPGYKIRTALLASGMPMDEAVTLMMDHVREVGLGSVFVGELAGYEVSGDSSQQLILHHRCGWSRLILASGVRANFSAYVGNVVETALDNNHNCREQTKRNPDNGR